MKNFPRLSPLVAALLFTGCANFEKPSKPTGQAQTPHLQHTEFRADPNWRQNTYRNEELIAKATPENSSIEVSLKEQRGFLVVGKNIAMDFPVATGRASFPTPAGTYKILSKDKDHASNLYGRIVSESGETLVSDANIRTDTIPEGASFVGAAMPFWMRITPDGVGFHVGYVPGRPASHGCIRLRRQTAQTLFNLLPVGTPVVIETYAPTVGAPATSSTPANKTATNKKPVTRRSTFLGSMKLGDDA